MTVEELIIGHYERTLTSDQETQLQQMVQAQPDVRVLFEQHGRIDGLLVAEAEAIDTTSKLDKVVVGAALGTLVEIAGKGIGFSLLGKIAAVVATVAVGTVGYVLVDPFGADEPSQRSPDVRTSAPATPTPQPAIIDSAADRPRITAEPNVAAAPDSAGTRTAAPTLPRSDGGRASASRPGAAPRIDLNPDSPDVTVPGQTRVGGPADGK